MFITTNTAFRAPLFLDPAYARTAIESMYRTQEIKPFFLHGFVIMPDHCHMLLYVPSPGSIAGVMNSYKRRVAFEIGKPLWQPRFHMRIPNNPGAALEYIHLNPIQAGLETIPGNYPWSSASGKWDMTPLDWM